jgi:hypothetical protein
MNRVTVKKPDENATKDASGKVKLSDETNWRIVCQRWCQVLPRGSREFQRQDQIGQEVTHLIRIRYDNESKKFKTKWKLAETVNSATRYFDLAGPGIDEDGEHKFLLFPAIEVPAV